MASKRACFYTPTLQYLNNAPSKRKYLKLDTSKERLLTDQRDGNRAKTPAKKNGGARHKVSKSLASVLKIDNRKSERKNKRHLIQVETEFGAATRYPPFPNTAKASEEELESLRQQRKVNLSLYLRMQNSVNRLSCGN